MSASNWAICPRCLSSARKLEAAALAKVMASYGKAPFEEFDQARRAIATPEREEFRTFREDYEIFGAEDGVVQVDYSGYCQVCELNLEFSEKRPIAGVGDS